MKRLISLFLCMAVMLLFSPAVNIATGDTPKAETKGCKCGPNCACEHCKTGKGECKCHADGKGGCKCGPNCACEHCKTGKGECKCRS